MKKKLLFRLLVILFATSAWSCADSSFDVDEEEELLFADLYVDNDKLELGDLLLPGYPIQFGIAISKIFLEKTMGSKLLNLIKRNDPYIRFLGDPALPPSRMDYGGLGTIFYPPNMLTASFIDVSLFHEFFHILQNGDIPQRSLNNEIEAYVACCLYSRRINTGAYEPIFNQYIPGFDNIIKALADAIDPELNGTKKTEAAKQLNANYRHAIELLKNSDQYNPEDGWHETPVSTNYFPNIVNLLNLKQ